MKLILLSILLALCCFSGMGQTKKTGKCPTDWVYLKEDINDDYNVIKKGCWPKKELDKAFSMLPAHKGVKLNIRYNGPDTARITQPNGEYVELVSGDTNHVRVFPICDTLIVRHNGLNLPISYDISISPTKYDTLINSHVTDTLHLDFLRGNPKEDDNREYQTDNRGIVFHPALFEDKPKYDTIGSWHLVAASDTVRGRFVQVGLCYIYEVRKYYNDWIMVTDGRTEWSSGQKEMFESPHHHAWLDYNKQPLKYVVIKEL